MEDYIAKFWPHWTIAVVALALVLKSAKYVYDNALRPVATGVGRIVAILEEVPLHQTAIDDLRSERAADSLKLSSLDSYVREQFNHDHGLSIRDILVETRDRVNVIGDMATMSEIRQRAVVATLPDGAYEVDAHGAVTYVNQAWLDITGLPREESLGFGFMAAVPKEKRAEVRAMRMKSPDEFYKDYTGPFTWERVTDGAKIETWVRFYWNRTPKGDITGGFGTLEVKSVTPKARRHK